MDIGESGNKKGGLKADDVPYKRLLIQGKDIRHEMGATFTPPPPGKVGKRLESEPAPNMAPSCARTYHGTVVNRKEEVEWAKGLGTSRVPEAKDIREFGNVCGYWVRQKCAHCGRAHWTDFYYKLGDFERREVKL